MSVLGGPGQGLTLQLDVDTVLARLRTIQLPEWSTEPVDFTGLSDLEWFQYIAATLKDGGQFVAEMYFNSEIPRPTPRIVQEATITFPVQSAGNAVQATLVGSGFVIGTQLPNAVVGEPMIEMLTFKYDGVGTPPAFTVEALA